MESVVKKCLIRRGYKIEKTKETLEHSKFIISFKNGEIPGKVFYLINEKIGLDDLRKIFREYINQNFHIIILYKDITSSAINSYNAHISKYMKYSEIIEDTYFFRDIISHDGEIFQYEKLSLKEKKKVFEVYRTSEDHIPKMQTDDPIAITLGFKDGDMIKVFCFYNFTEKRVDHDMPPSITYNLVEDYSKRNG